MFSVLIITFPSNNNNCCHTAYCKYKPQNCVGCVACIRHIVYCWCCCLRCAGICAVTCVDYCIFVNNSVCGQSVCFKDECFCCCIKFAADIVSLTIMNADYTVCTGNIAVCINQSIINYQRNLY